MEITKEKLVPSFDHQRLIEWLDCQIGYLGESINKSHNRKFEVKIKKVPWYPSDDNSGHGIQEMLALLDNCLLAPHYWCCCQELLHIWTQDKRGALSDQLAWDLGYYLETAKHNNWQSANIRFGVFLSWYFIFKYIIFSGNSKQLINILLTESGSGQITNFRKPSKTGRETNTLELDIFTFYS